MAKPVLRYQQVMQLVERLVAERGLAPGDRLPTNDELAAMAGVSLMSVRRGLDELEREGRVARHQGVGTFVADPRIVSDPARAGGLRSTLGAGDDGPAVETRLLAAVRGVAGPAVADALGLEPPVQVWEIRRLRLLNGRPEIFERAVLPVALVPQVDREVLAAGGSLYRFLAERYGLVDSYEEQYLEVATPSRDERRLLGLPPRRSVVRLRGVSFAADGTPFDCFHQSYPADDFVFFISGQTNRRLVRTGDERDWGVVPLAGRDTERDEGRRRARDPG